MSDDSDRQQKSNGGGAADRPAQKAPWSEPKLEFVEPALRREGDLTELTGTGKPGFFGTFIPKL